MSDDESLVLALKWARYWKVQDCSTWSQCLPEKLKMVQMRRWNRMICLATQSLVGHYNLRVFDVVSSSVNREAKDKIFFSCRDLDEI